jgi:hypothetical protein
MRKGSNFASPGWKAVLKFRTRNYAKDRKVASEEEMRNPKLPKFPLIAASYPNCFQEKIIEKQHVVDCVALPEPARLHREPEEPFQPDIHHPAWGLPHFSREEVECSPDPMHHGDIQLLPMVEHPDILLRCSQANPKNVGLSRIDHRTHFVLFFRELTEEAAFINVSHQIL